MSYGEFLQSFFAQCWRVFQLHIPIIDISFGSVFIGLFVVSIGFFILHSYFGLANQVGSFDLQWDHGRGKRYSRRGKS